MIEFTEVDWIKVLPHFGISQDYLKKQHGPCPICSHTVIPGKSKHGGLKRFRFANTNGVGTWFCSTCGGGNGFNLIQKFTNKTTHEILCGIEEALGLETPKVEKPVALIEPVEMSVEEAKRNAGRLKELFKGAVNISNDPVTKYLESRVPKLNLKCISKDIFHHPAVQYYEYDDDDNLKYRGRFPAMLAKVRDGSGNAITIHRTYLTKDGKKAPFEKVKKVMSGVRKLLGASIRLNNVPRSRVLGVCEGIETGYAIATAYRNSINVWSLLNCVNLAVADLPRERFDKVIIFADFDEIDVTKNYRPGEHFARKLKEKLELQGFEVVLKIPPRVGMDFADLWQEYVDSLVSECAHA